MCVSRVSVSKRIVVKYRNVPPPPKTNDCWIVGLRDDM